MDKEAILSAARKENKNHDIVEKHIEKEAGSFADTVGAVICLLLIIMSKAITGEIEFACLIVYEGMLATRVIVRSRLKKDKVGTALGILLGILTLAAMAVYVCNLAGVL